MKKLFIVICALFVGFAYGANENVPTSKKFVDAALAQKQPKFDGLGNDKLMLYSNTTDGVVASRDIVTTLGNSTSANTVPTVGAINTGLNTKQDMLNGDAGWVAENTGIAGAVVQKPVYSATNNYSNALVEVETLNNAVINAVNSELTVVPGVGWTINTVNNLNLLPTPQTYNDVPPGGYTRLEYLASTGAQCIDTGVVLTSDDVVYEFEVKDTDLYNGTLYTSLFGSETYDADHVRLFSGILHSDHNTKRAPYVGNKNTSSIGYDMTDNEFHGCRWVINSDHTQYLVIDGEKRQTKSWSGHLNNATPIAIFCNFVDGTSYRQYATASFKYFRIIDNGRMVFNGIPAHRNSDNKPGIYDTVSNRFLTNMRTGADFTAGPVVTGN